MRWINIRDGIKQRVNEILGKGTNNSDPASNTPTDWSIQSAMLENLRRIVTALVGDNASLGRPMKGCIISTGGGQTIDISEGMAFTRNGNIIMFGGVSGFDLSSEAGNSVSIALKHINTEIDGDSGEAFPNVGKTTGLIGKLNEVEIVNDDSGVEVDGSTLIVVDESTAENYCYLGTVAVPSGIDPIESSHISNTDRRGLAPNKNLSNVTPSLTVTTFLSSTGAGGSTFANVVINGTATLEGSVIVKDLLDLSQDSGRIKIRDVTNSVQVGASSYGVDSFSGAPASITIKQGIITDALAS